ncbi:ankyrin repeat-containing protein [Penicillium lagena]|uniref:ankyrin repeat-containing protein n=1 Tax=Penicillium lagena TaxID=94218 RepID=UPI00253FE91D|nr:ankyrin repeat-containing protein [Penicillium lagena]KAJ5624425.1 ankyrin repeat-containing protein [Penicillium lagena]
MIMLLPQLPSELLLLIARFFETTRDINSLSQANKRLHALLDRYLYTLDAQGSNAALFWGAQRGNEDTVRRCLQMGAKVELMELGRTPLSLAAEHGHEAVVKLLLETDGVDADSNRGEDRTPLSFAAEYDRWKVVELLLETGRVDVDSKDNDLWTPLFYAAGSGSERVLKLLLETGQANVDSRDYSRDTPLSWGAIKGHKGAVKLLLETGMTVVHSESEGLFGWMGLHSAAQQGWEEVKKLLLRTRQVDRNLSESEGWTLSSLVALDACEATMKLLLETDRVASDSCHTSFSWAARYGRGAVVRLLMETGQIGVDPKDSTRYMPLSLSAKYGYEAVVNILLGTHLRSMSTNRPQNGENFGQTFGSWPYG